MARFFIINLGKTPGPSAATKPSSVSGNSMLKKQWNCMVILETTVQKINEKDQINLLSGNWV